MTDAATIDARSGTPAMYEGAGQLASTRRWIAL